MKLWLCVKKEEEEEQGLGILVRDAEHESILFFFHFSFIFFVANKYINRSAIWWDGWMNGWIAGWSDGWMDDINNKPCAELSGWSLSPTIYPTNQPTVHSFIQSLLLFVWARHLNIKHNQI